MSVHEVVCAYGFEIFEMYELSIYIFIKALSYESFDMKCFLPSWNDCVYRQARGW